MLYNIFIAILVAVTAIFSFFAGYKVFSIGFQVGFKTGRGEEQVKIPEILPKKPKKAKPSPEVERMNRVLANIEKYDGTSAGQEDIK